jgi:hypothetical protein
MFGQITSDGREVPDHKLGQGEGLGGDERRS